jgi:hypothetical protein
MLLVPAPQKFNTFNTFNTFANINPTLEHPTPIHHHPPRPGSISGRTFPTPQPLSHRNGPGTLWVAVGVRAVQGKGVRVSSGD